MVLDTLIEITSVPPIYNRFVNTMHPTERRPIQLGDKFMTAKTKSGNSYQYENYRGQVVVVEAGYCQEVSVHKTCDCPMSLLMSEGCKCGGL